MNILNFYTNDRIKRNNKDWRPRNIAIIIKIYQPQPSSFFPFFF